MTDRSNTADSRHGGSAVRSAGSSSRKVRERKVFGLVAWTAFALVVLALVVYPVYSYLFTGGGIPFYSHWFAWAAMAPDHYGWYGDWRAVAFAVVYFSIFVLAFLYSPRRRGWRHLGVAEAFLVALFTEMFGLPLTIYLLGSVFGVSLGFGMMEGHLWAVLLDRLGLLPLWWGVSLVMAVSGALINLGIALMAAGWWQVWRAKDELVTGGLYRFVRHPQYTGFLLLITGFLIQWPTLLTLVLFPILVVVYVRLARREERELEQQFGERYVAYREKTPMLLPGPKWGNAVRALASGKAR